MTDLTIQLAIILTGKQLFGQFNEIIWPYVTIFFISPFLKKISFN